MSDEQKCPACGGNDRNMACAYPGNHEQQPGCLRADRLARQAAWEAAAPDAGDLVDSRKFVAIRIIEGESKWPVEQRVNAVEASFAKAQAATIAALRQANKDCVDHFEALKVDYDALRRDVEELKAYGSNAYSQGFRDGVAKLEEMRIRAEAAERELAACREENKQLHRMQPPVAKIIGRSPDMDCYLEIITTYLSDAGHVFIVDIGASLDAARGAK